MEIVFSPTKIALAVAVAALAWSAAARAAGDADVRACFGGEGDQHLAACDRLIDSGKYAGRSLSALYVSRGVVWQVRRRAYRAFADFERAVAADATFAQAWITRGLSYQERDRHDLAIADFTRAIRLEPDNVVALKERGRSLAITGDIDRGLADLDAALRIAPDHADALKVRVLIEQRKGDSAAGATSAQSRLVP
jgi:tetratricopeptide (TPR) repeat protein